MSRYNLVEESRDLTYYANIDKVFWVCAEPLKGFWERYEKVPCLFVEIRDRKAYILRFDYSIEFNSYKYTAWRKVIGIAYDIRVDVYLIKCNKLWTLSGKEVDFDSLGRSDILVDKSYLAIMEHRTIAKL